MIEKTFVNDGIMKVRLEEFLDGTLGRANYSHVEINKTPVSTRIVIYAQKPGLVIGRGGSRINQIVDILKENYGIENPVVEAEEVANADLDAQIVAKNIANWIERGGHPKRVGNIYLRRVMDAGAVGAQVAISGKLSGERNQTQKFTDGYLKMCGRDAETDVDSGYQLAVTKPGAIGVKVKIMKEMPDYLQFMERISHLGTEDSSESQQGTISGTQAETVTEEANEDERVATDTQEVSEDTMTEEQAEETNEDHTAEEEKGAAESDTREADTSSNEGNEAVEDSQSDDPESHTENEETEEEETTEEKKTSAGEDNGDTKSK